MFRTLIFTLLLAATAQAGALFTSTHAGEWGGVGVQSDGSNWDLFVTIEDKQSLVSYPRLYCGGQWQYLEIGADTLRAVENIEYGESNCINSGTILLSQHEDDRLIYVWCGEDGAVSALALLERPDASDRRYGEMLNATQAMIEAVGNDLESITCQDNIWLGV